MFAATSPAGCGSTSPHPASVAACLPTKMPLSLPRKASRSPTTPSLFTGKVVHALVETLVSSSPIGHSLTPDDIARRLVESWGQVLAEEDMKFDSADRRAGIQKQAVGLVTAYLAYVPVNEPRPWPWRRRWKPHWSIPTGEDLGIPLVGIMDLVLDDPAGPVIADFKTSAKRPSRWKSPMKSSLPVIPICFAIVPNGRRPAWRSGPSSRPRHQKSSSTPTQPAPRATCCGYLR